MEEYTPKLPDTKAYPFYIKATTVLLGLVLFCYALYLLASVLVPFAFACLLAILLNPLGNWLHRFMPRGMAIFLAILLGMLCLATLLYLLSKQIIAFSESLPALKEKSMLISKQLQQWVSEHLGLSINKQFEMLDNALKGSDTYVKATVSSIVGGMIVLVLIPIYIFFLLFYKPLILDFFFHVFSKKYSSRIAEILGETKTAIQSYVVGLLLEMVIVSTLNSVALLVLGVRSAILIGVIGGILNVIPYLGGIIAIGLPIVMASITKDGYTTQLGIIFSYMVIQFIDNHIIVPQVVSSKVSINALVSILIVLCGDLLWGYSGMFLSIPFVAILKIIFDRIDGLRPWGTLLGTKMPDEYAGRKWKLTFYNKTQSLNK